MRKLVLAALVVGLMTVPAASTNASPISLVVRSLDGSGNNLAHPTWGAANTQYIRVAPPNYADGIGAMVAGPPTRYLSNRIFNDVGQNLFSENGVTQMGWLWGQFIDHDIGLRDETPAERVPIAFDAHDPLETFRDDFGTIDFARTPAAPGTGVTTRRQQLNTISSYIDASQVYGTTNARLDWLRAGSADGDPTNNSAMLLLPGGYLPREDARGNAAAAPPMDLFAGQVANPARAVEAGDVRANENIGLTGMQTLLAREHNRIVSLLPNVLSQEDKFQVARRVVGAEIQYITYNEFLPNLGVKLPAYKGYDPGVNASIGNEFASFGFRAHSMVHGEIEPSAPAGTWTAAQLAAFQKQGIQIENDGATVTLVIPLVDAFGNPDLVEQVGLGPLLEGLAAEREYRNDEQIDNSLRSVLFQVPKPGALDPTVCGSPVIDPSCFVGVSDLGAIDVQRDRDHGMPSYNDARAAFGLPRVTSFTAITGESTAALPAGMTINNPHILDFVQLRDDHGNVIPLGSPDAQEDAVVGVRRSTLASRLKAIYGNVNAVDAFVGMVSEAHVAGTEFGPLQLAMWRQQFAALRDGDRFFYAIDPALPLIRSLFGIDYRHTLADLIRLDAGTTLQPDVFKVVGD
ncbi:MAG TPA: peroxidase family protein [Gaiellaceae bacterium]|nr:peroxidase family protein [Gaiellaceae bacterium]